MSRARESWRGGREEGLLASAAAARGLPDETTCVPRGRDPHTTGVVVVHGGHTFETSADGKRSRLPGGRSTDPFVGVLKRAGFHVITPEMPWSLAHPYDRSFEEALDEIAVAVDRLKADGAERVVIVGHSLRGGAVIGFGAWHGGIDGVAALAAGLNPDTPPQPEWRAVSVAQAEAMMAAGRANKIPPF